MGKKNKTVDLKPKAEKISEEKLEELQDVVNAVNRVKLDIGTLEAQKHSMLHTLTKVNEKISEIQKNFQKEYGTYDVSIVDGTINYNDGQTDKKD